MKYRATLGIAAALCGGLFGGMNAQAETVKIGVLGDLSSVYSGIGGKGLVDAARMAVEDFGGQALGSPIELVYVDTQNKTDIAAAKARQWFDVDNVDMVTDLPTSGIALAIAKLGEEKKDRHGHQRRVIGHHRSQLHALLDPLDLRHLCTGTQHRCRRRQAGWQDLVFLSADYAFGQALERDTTAIVTELGGKVLGSAKHPLGASDFASYLLQAQASKAQIVALANGGQDTINSIKQAKQFGLAQGGQKLAALLAFLSDVKAVGLKDAQGLLLTEAFYWDQTDATRAWSERFYKRNKVMPTMTQAGTYGAVTHYLNAVKAAGTKDSDKVMAQMRATPINDFMTRNGTLRIDGRVVRDMYLYQVKSPAESKGEWDLYKVLATTPGELAFRPLDQGGCKLVK